MTERITPETIIGENVQWISALSSRFPTHRSVQRFKALLQKIAEASAYDPGETDLDDEQPVRAIGFTLGDVRLARRLLR